MDRVQIAVDMMNYDVPEGDRNPAYYQGYVRMVIAQFGGGLKEEIKSKVSEFLLLLTISPTC